MWLSRFFHGFWPQDCVGKMWPKSILQRSRADFSISRIFLFTVFQCSSDFLMCLVHSGKMSVDHQLMSIFIISESVTVCRCFFCLQSFWLTSDFFIVRKGKNSRTMLHHGKFWRHVYEYIGFFPKINKWHVFTRYWHWKQVTQVSFHWVDWWNSFWWLSWVSECRWSHVLLVDEQIENR